MKKEYRVYLGSEKRPVWQVADSPAEAERLVQAEFEKQFGPADFTFRADKEPIDFTPQKIN